MSENHPKGFNNGVIEGRGIEDEKEDDDDGGDMDAIAISPIESSLKPRGKLGPSSNALRPACTVSGKFGHV